MPFTFFLIPSSNRLAFMPSSLDSPTFIFFCPYRWVEIPVSFFLFLLKQKYNENSFSITNFIIFLKWSIRCDKFNYSWNWKEKKGIYRHTHTHTHIYIYTYKVYYKTKMKKFCYMLGKVNIKSKKMRLFVSFFLG